MKGNSVFQGESSLSNGKMQRRRREQETTAGTRILIGDCHSLQQPYDMKCNQPSNRVNKNLPITMAQ